MNDKLYILLIASLVLMAVSSIYLRADTASNVGVGLLVSGSDLDDDESIYFSFSREIEL